MIDPELMLDAAERRELVRVCQMPGFAILKKIAMSVVEQFRLDLDNANPASTSDVMAKHSLSRSASLFYQRWLDKLQHEIDQVELESTRGETLQDEAGPVLDMDDLAEATKDMPNFFGQPDVIIESEES